MGGVRQLLSQTRLERCRKTFAVGINFDDWAVHIILVGRVYLKTGKSKPPGGD